MKGKHRENGILTAAWRREDAANQSGEKSRASYLMSLKPQFPHNDTFSYNILNSWDFYENYIRRYILSTQHNSQNIVKLNPLLLFFIRILNSQVYFNVERKVVNEKEKTDIVFYISFQTIFLQTQIESVNYKFMNLRI